MADSMKDILIAHRGEPENWPENSLPGYQAVLEAGARYIETDVQISADGVAVLSHDPSLLKASGHDLLITATDYRTLSACPAGHPELFGSRYQQLHIARLDEFAALLQQWPQARAFVELKPDSIQAHGISRMFHIVMDNLSAVLEQCALISFDYAALQHVRMHSRLPIGWVLPEWSTENRALAADLAPEYLFCNRKRLPPERAPLWPGPWQWVIYTLNEPAEIRRYLERGAHMAETNVIRKLLAAPGLPG
jgi:glycerophosphoryl diester phosphodiesterase